MDDVLLKRRECLGPVPEYVGLRLDLYHEAAGKPDHESLAVLEGLRVAQECPEVLDLAPPRVYDRHSAHVGL